MGPILIASGNPHKQDEIERILRGAGLAVELVRPDSLALPSPPPRPAEDGDSYLENAAIKARAFSRWSGLPALADDSGLEVDSLGGEPGLRSARYAGGSGSEVGDADARNRAKLLAALAGRPPAERRARFVCALALCRGDELLVAVEERCEGTILDAPRGQDGFGYDPVFLPAAGDRSFSELTPAEKDDASHRGRALRALAARISAAARVAGSASPR